MSTFDTVMDQFAEGLDFSTFSDDPSSLMSAGRTTTLVKGRRVPFNATFGGQEFPGYVTLESARLQRISIMDHVSKKQGTTTNLISGIFKPVKLNVEIVFEGDVLTLPNLLRKFVTRNIPIDKQISEEQFIATAEQLGIKFASGMSMFWQQFGASQEGINHLVNTFKSAGAVDAMGSMTNPGRIKQCYNMPKINDIEAEGPEVLSFELGRADRTQSMTGQGYLDLVEAVSENFKRVYKLRKEAAMLKQSNIAKATAENWTQERSQQAQKDATEVYRTSQQWATSWSGAQQRMTVDPKDPSVRSFVVPTIYDPTSAPCGRFKLSVNGNEVAIDLWTNSARANTSDNAVSATSTVQQKVDNEVLTWS